MNKFFRMICIYFIKKLFKIFFHFCTFCTEVKIQLNVSIHVLRNGNVTTKWLNKGFFSSLLVLIHHFKMELLKEKTNIYLRLFESFVPNISPYAIMVDAIFTSCFFINFLSSTVLGEDVTYNIFFQISHYCRWNLRHLVAIRDIQSNVIKLDPKTLKCVFWDILA